MGRTALLPAAVLVVGLAGGCGSASSPAASSVTGSSASAPPVPAVPAVPGIEAEAVRLRTDEAVGGQVQVRITNTGERPFTVTAVAIESPGFALLPGTQVTAEYAPGRVIDLPTPYGEPVCSAAAEPAVARVTVVRSDGVVEDLRVPLAAEILTVIHAEECAVLAVAEVATITVGDLAPDGDRVTGTVVLTRAGDDDRAVTAERLQGNVLYEATAELPVELGPAAGRATFEVTFTLATCDTHVLAEVKQPYVFPLVVRVAGDEEVPVDLPLGEEQRAVLAALKDRVCAGA